MLGWSSARYWRWRYLFHPRPRPTCSVLSAFASPLLSLLLLPAFLLESHHFRVTPVFFWSLSLETKSEDEGCCRRFEDEVLCFDSFLAGKSKVRGFITQLLRNYTHSLLSSLSSHKGQFALFFPSHLTHLAVMHSTTRWLARAGSFAPRGPRFWVQKIGWLQPTNFLKRWEPCSLFAPQSQIFSIDILGGPSCPQYLRMCPNEWLRFTAFSGTCAHKPSP